MRRQWPPRAAASLTIIGSHISVSASSSRSSASSRHKPELMDPFVAEIRIFAFNFAPKGWAFCDGQLLPLSQNTALFSLVGTFYGGDGKSTFALPDLQGAAPMQIGQGQGLSQRFLGEMSGSESVTLLISETPVHTHNIMASAGIANLNAPGTDRALARSSGGTIYQAT